MRGKFQDQGTAFEVEIVTENISLADKIQVVESTGSMRSVYFDLLTSKASGASAGVNTIAHTKNLP